VSQEKKKRKPGQEPGMWRIRHRTGKKIMSPKKGMLKAGNPTSNREEKKTRHNGEGYYTGTKKINRNSHTEESRDRALKKKNAQVKNHRKKKNGTLTKKREKEPRSG